MTALTLMLPIESKDAKPAVLLEPGVFSAAIRTECGWDDADDLVATPPTADIVAITTVDPGSEAESVYLCLLERIPELAGIYPERALALLFDIAEFDRRFAASYCHFIAHSAGGIALQRLGPEQSLRLAPTFCLGGYIHGVFEYASDRAAEADNMLSRCREVVDDGSYYLHYECLHGYGHLIAMGEVTSLKSVLERCVPVSGDEREFEGCASGVTGALHIRVLGGLEHAYAPIGEKFLDVRSLREACSSLESPYTRGCWRTVAVFWQAAGITPLEQAELCVASGFTVCGLGIGQNMTPGTSSDIHERGEQHCSIFAGLPESDARDHQWAACRSGAVFREMQFLEAAGWQGSACDGYLPEHRDECRTFELYNRSIDASLEETKSFGELRVVQRMLAAN